LHPQEEAIIASVDIPRLIIRAAMEKKAEDLAILDVNGRTSYCDLFIICNGANHRQVKAIAENVLETLRKEAGARPVGVEGLESGRWVLVDYGDVVLHVFESTLRGYYDLDGLWMDAPRLSPESLGMREIEAVETKGAAPDGVPVLSP